MKILYAGTPEFAVPALNMLADSGFPPATILTQPDRPAGRGRKLVFSPVKEAALARGIPVYQPQSLREPEAITWLSCQQPDLVVVVAYGLILPPQVLEIPRHGCWNIHASLLPRWRGAAPVQRAIEAGDVETGICIMQMDQGLDTGPVLHRVSTPILPQDTSGTLAERLAKLGGETLIGCVALLADGQSLPTQPQPTEGVTYARKLAKEEARLDWSQAAGMLERQIRAFNPWPVSWCDIAGERTRIWASCTARADATETAVQSDPVNPPGTLIRASSDGIDVATGQGDLRLLRLQRPGGKAITAAEYLNARNLPTRLVIK